LQQARKYKQALARYINAERKKEGGGRRRRRPKRRQRRRPARRRRRAKAPRMSGHGGNSSPRVV
jgi:hypothetical protein